MATDLESIGETPLPAELIPLGSINQSTRSSTEDPQALSCRVKASGALQNLFDASDGSREASSLSSLLTRDSPKSFSSFCSMRVLIRSESVVSQVLPIVLLRIADLDRGAAAASAPVVVWGLSTSELSDARAQVFERKTFFGDEGSSGSCSALEIETLRLSFLRLLGGDGSCSGTAAFLALAAEALLRPQAAARPAWRPADSQSFCLDCRPRGVSSSVPVLQGLPPKAEAAGGGDGAAEAVAGVVACDDAVSQALPGESCLN